MRILTRCLARSLALVTLLAAAGHADAQEPVTSPRAGTGGLFEEMPVVEAAALHTQTLQEAPANVTVISDDDIRKYGYRTLGDALSGARGFYKTSDHAYQYVGLRGFALPGDLNTRFLVMIDGHVMTDIIYNENGFFGQDFGLDMDLVKRIEIIRGPASALYGSNGIFCTVNIVTKSPVEHPAGRLTTETGSFGEKKAQVSSSQNLGRGANLLLSMSVFHNAGQTLYYPEFDSPQTGNGWARDVDGERGYHAFANLVWGNWSLLANLSTREKHVPVLPWSPTLFGDRGTRIQDGHDFVEARYSRDLGVANHVQFRAYYDRYRFLGRYDYATDSGTGIQDTRDIGHGDWVGSQVTFRRQWSRFGATTAGVEFIDEIKNLQRTDDVSPVPENIAFIEKPDARGSIFGQQELNLTTRWKADLGLRYDASRLHAGVLSPRAALLFRQSPVTVFKLLWGRAFRNPSALESYWYDAVSQLANPDLRPERTDTWEASWERVVHQRINLVATAYRYNLRDMIVAASVGAETYQFKNADQGHAYGTEFEINGHFTDRLEGGVSLALQRAEHAADGTVMPNSPGRVGKVRLSAPLWRRKLYLSTEWQYLSSRDTLAGNVLPGMAVGNLNISTFGLNPCFDIQFGVRNLLNRQYNDPTGGGWVIDTIRADGRAAYVKVIWHTRD